MTLSPRSGGYDVNTPVDARGYLLPSTQERIQYLHAKMDRLQERREVLYGMLGHPNARGIKHYKHHEFEQRRFPPELLKEYFDVGEQISAYCSELNTLNKHLRQTTDESFETMFVRAAKNILPPEEFARVKKYTNLLMTELADTVCLPQEMIDD